MAHDSIEYSVLYLIYRLTLKSLSKMSASSWAAQPRPSPLPQLNRRVIDTTHASPVCYRSNAEARLFDRVDEWMSKLIQASGEFFMIFPQTDTKTYS